MNKKKNKRREFLALGLLAGAGALAGFKTGEFLSENGEKVRLITADGKVVEVDAKHLPLSNGKPISNAELQKWLENEKMKE
jgi:spermidine/putrescine-binding protein